MMKQIFSLLFIATMVLFSCTKDTDLIDEQSVTDAVLESRTDTNDCFQFVFPVSFLLPDNSTVEVNSIGEAQALRDSTQGKIRLAFPVDIINSSGETVTIADHEQMHAILLDCGIIEQNGKGGKHGKGGHDGKGGKGMGGFFRPNDCFQFVFPVSVQLPDSSIVQIDSLAEAQNLEKSTNGRIKLVFPFSIINSNGETVVITNGEELNVIMENCRPANGGGFGNGGDHGNGNHGGNGGNNDHPKCFEIVFPVNMVFSDGAVKSFSDEISMQEAIRTWMKANPGKKDRPEFQFPIKVIKSGEINPTVINSKEELEALRKNC